MIKKIYQTSIIINVVVVLLFLIFKDYKAIWVYLLGSGASSFNFYLNAKLLNLDQTNNVFVKNLSSFAIRMLVYMIVLNYVIFKFNEIYVLVSFLGCLSIRYAILLTFILRKGEEL
ncbi:MAG: ATP synthase subunit I [Bacilli bacterium]